MENLTVTANDVIVDIRQLANSLQRMNHDNALRPGFVLETAVEHLILVLNSIDPDTGEWGI